jgi:hypothetical protein
MRISRLGHFTAAAGLVGAATLVATGASAAGAVQWHVPPPVPPPAGATSSVLQDVSVLAPADVWAVGAWWSTAVHPFAVHWNGQAWAAVPQPELTRPTYLTGVDALVTDDVWAVGSSDEQPEDTAPPAGVVLHFDGGAWSVVPSPAAPAGVASDLDDVDMRISGDGWAVGRLGKGGQTQPLVLHWRAGAWTSAALPDLPGVALTSVSVTAADDVWAAGTATDASGATTAAVLHFDGVSWTRVDVPAPFGSSLTSIAATSAGDVWAGGSTCIEVICLPLVLHRTGTGWRAEATAAGAVVTEVVALSPANVWTVGFRRGSTGVRNGHVEHWNGKSFQTDNSVLIPTGGADPQGEIASAIPLAGAAGDPASGAVWAVGWSNGPARTPNVIYRG